MTTKETKKEMRRRAESVNRTIAFDMLSNLPENKMQALGKALDRNLYLTSSRNLEHGTLLIYKEGYYLQLEGTRCSFSVFAYDNDGELEIARKPSDEKLSFLYSQDLRFGENDFSRLGRRSDLCSEELLTSGGNSKG